MNKNKLLKMHLQYFAEDPQDELGNPNGDDPKDKVDDVTKGKSEENASDKGKTYTQEEFEKAIQERVAREKKAKEKAIAEAEKLAKMNADEKEQYEREQLEKELAEYKKKDQFYSMSKEASKMLSEHDIQADDDLLAFVVKDDADATKQAVTSFVGLVNAKVEQGVKKALTGKTPKIHNVSNKTITKEQINNIKDATERIQAIRDNPHLFK